MAGGREGHGCQGDKAFFPAATGVAARKKRPRRAAARAGKAAGPEAQKKTTDLKSNYCIIFYFYFYSFGRSFAPELNKH
jgi:hypothetical protein